MAKLNKQEVYAIASKLHRELENAAVLQRRNAMRTYTPSKLYQQILEFTSKRDELDLQIKKLMSQKEGYVEAIDQLLRKEMNWWWKGNTESDKLLYEIVKEECSLKSVPSIDELKDNVTIAAIDCSFNTASFIEEQLKLFQ